MRIDWLEGTIIKRQVDAALMELQRYFVGLDWKELPHGARGYSHSASIAETGRVMWDPERQDMGVHVILPSKAIDQIGVKPENLATDLYYMGFKCSRLDVAADDFDGVADLAEVQRQVLAKEYVCRSSHSKEERDLAGGAGHTIYFGKRTSESFFRIYDKSQEQADKHLGVYTSWVRAELELKGDRAAAALRVIVHNPDCWHERAAGWMRSYLDFKIPGADKNKSRWETAAWWLKFLEHAVKCRLVLDVVKRSLEDVRRWVDKQVVPSLYMLGQTLGYTELFELVLTGKERLSERHDEMMAAYSRMLEQCAPVGV